MTAKRHKLPRRPGAVLTRITQTVAGVVLLAASLARGQTSNSAWTDFKTEIRPLPQKWNPRYPLSDQANKGRWARFKPMSDEFNGSRLDAAKWWNYNPGWHGREPAWFLPSNVTVSGGMLHLAMRKEQPPPDALVRGYTNYTSAAVQSRRTTLYGYFETRARAMKSAGSSAFWLFKADPGLWTEIDIFEIGGRSPGYERKLNMTAHVFAAPGVDKHLSWGSFFRSPADLAGDFHVYGLEWDREAIRYYFDGSLVRSGTNAYWHQPLTLNFDAETAPDWFGLPADADLPSFYDIDYARAWKHKDAAK
jgi:beta-glucanase (GH16 family)